MSPSNQKAHGKTKKPASAPLCTSNILSKFLDAPSAAPATHVAFCKFIELADLKFIKQFLAITFLSPDSQNLKLLWAHAFKEEYVMGQASHTDASEVFKATL